MPAAVPLRRDFDASSLRRLALNNRQIRERARIVETGSDRESTGRAMVWCAGGASIRFGLSINVSAWHVGKAWCRTILLNRAFPTSRGVRGTRPGTVR